MNQLQKLSHEFKEESKLWIMNKSFHDECFKTVEELDNERKGHAEELRQINQVKRQGLFRI